MGRPDEVQGPHEGMQGGHQHQHAVDGDALTPQGLAVAGEDPLEVPLQPPLSGQKARGGAGGHLAEGGDGNVLDARDGSRHAANHTRLQPQSSSADPKTDRTSGIAEQPADPTAI